ncbi:hypothetical protein GFD17_07030 [Bifidobacterium sp. SMB2]|uniref:Uncharacterized protein n=1 Tax=Bifidobacterium saimiriisciurei TaxID=2661627 RepID=A0ABX0CDT0_9BIFI|nr:MULTISPECIES: glycosyl hydrolase family 28 protein [Bifidobacterium]NEG96503.1 hypothetical protein [Bifidobacterium sp. SMB2]NEH10580.1 hypothetical protein [Bifidobacterium saimiriisciurei]NEH10637.1 hypothetical protein [Bifidobacterium saimiriisciurei]
MIPSSDDSTIRMYPVPAGAVLQHDLIVRVRTVGDDAWHEVPTYRVKVDMHDVSEASMAYFDFEGVVEVEVTRPGWWYCYTADIRPLVLGIAPQVEPRRVAFRLDRPANLSVELNCDRRHNLHLFAGSIADVDALERPGDKADVVVEGRMDGPNTLGRDVLLQLENIRRGRPLDAGYLDGTRFCGDDADDVTADDTGDFNEAPSSIEPDRRLVIRVKPGHYLIEDGVMNLPSHTTLILEGGAVVEGALRVDCAEDVRVMGRGILHLADFKRFAGTCAIAVANSRNVEIAGICCINPPHYTVMLGSSRDVVIRDLKSFSCEGWSDGIDMMSCSDVTIERCFLRTSDDCIAIYGSRWEYRGDTRNVAVRDCVLWSDVAHPTMIGTHGDYLHGGDIIENVAFENIDVLEHNEYQPGYLGVMAINVGDGNLARDIAYRGVRVESFRHGRVFDFRVRQNPDYNPIPGRGVEHVTVENVEIADGSGEEPSLIAGFDGARMVRNVRFVDVTRGGRPCRTLGELNVHVGEYAADVHV